MFKKLIFDKLDIFSNLGEGIEKILDSDAVSKIDENNKPFDLDILPEEIGLSELKVDLPTYIYKGNAHRCRLKLINLTRTFKLNDNFNLLNNDEKKIILDDLIPILKERFTHIYKIIEKRNHFLVADYVENYVQYICYGNKVIC